MISIYMGRMILKSIPIGEKIKELRLLRKMTQQELVGDHITRNMLSKIENDSATPSVRTLEYLAGKLGVPPGALLNEYDHHPESDVSFPDDFSTDLYSALDEARDAFRNNEPEHSIRLIMTSLGDKYETITEDDGPGYDEAKLLLAMAYLLLAEKAFALKDFTLLASCTESCMKFNRSGLYFNQTLEAKAIILMNEIARN